MQVDHLVSHPVIVSILRSHERGHIKYVIIVAWPSDKALCW